MSDSKPGPPAVPQLTVDPELARGEYANFVSIAHNFSEVLLDFGRTMPGRPDIPVVARIIMNPFHAKQLLRAISHNLQLYEKSFGPIKEPPTPGPAAPPESTN
ncbi:MAG: DUF3467 domain-containing protein [Thermoanaerobaculales bacterium]|nr:DUF3467 domain-containing protein [Thermoanaerobaculales bacterium]